MHSGKFGTPGPNWCQMARENITHGQSISRTALYEHWQDCDVVGTGSSGDKCASYEPHGSTQFESKMVGVRTGMYFKQTIVGSDCILQSWICAKFPYFQMGVSVKVCCGQISKLRLGHSQAAVSAKHHQQGV